MRIPAWIAKYARHGFDKPNNPGNSRMKSGADDTPVGETAWHALECDEAIAKLDTDSDQGLGADAVRERLGRFGPNRLPPPRQHGPLVRFLLQFHNLLIYVLIAAGAVKVVMGGYVDASVIFGVVVINAFLGFFQEGKAEKALASIRGLLSADAMVVRDGKTRSIPAEDLVPGDVVLLQSGDKVPADIRLSSTRNLRAEEAALTGESVPSSKSTAAVDEKAGVGDRECMAYSGTLIVSGRGRGVVVATGGETEIGRINRMLSEVKSLETPLLRQIHGFAKILTVIILAICGLVFLYGLVLRDYGVQEMFQAAVGVAVAAIPEGLPAIITITLAIGVQRMAKRKAIIRRLPAVETLGSVSRICSDKTGTLTRNEMMVVSVCTAGNQYEVRGTGYEPEGEVISGEGGDDAALPLVARAALLCNDAELHADGDKWKLDGDPTEGALLAFGARAELNRDAEREAWPRTDAIPFESENRFMATLHEADGERVVFLKGAPEKVLEHCKSVQLADGKETDSLDHEKWHQRAEELAGKGRRVLAFAILRGDDAPTGELHVDTLPDAFTLLGLVGIIDPPREEAIQAVKDCHRGGIRVTMITGDHAITAAAIAKELNIGDGKSVIKGAEIEEMDDETLRGRCREIDVFARSSPEHKLRLVRAMQAEKQIVAMTGDGVNDAPALKQADVGVAMGIKGTEVSKEAAEMVLADDNFASISAAVREGRTVYNNIEKAILFILPTNGGQSLTILAAILFGLVLPVTPPQILWINMVTAVTLALALSFEPHERGVMNRPPRPVGRPLLTPFGLWRIGFISILLLVFTFGAFYVMQNLVGASLELSRTTAINALIIGQVAYLLNSRFLFASCLSRAALTGNPYVPTAIGLIVLLQLAFTYAPPMQFLFGTDGLPWDIWPILVVCGLVLFLIVEFEKGIFRRLRGETAPEA